MSYNSHYGEIAQAPMFPIPTPEAPVQVPGQEPITAQEAIEGLERELQLTTGERVERCYVANRPGDKEHAGLLIASVVVSADGYKRDTEILVNDDQRHERLGERAITWFGLVAYAHTYDSETYKYFMRGHAPLVVGEKDTASSVAA